MPFKDPQRKKEYNRQYQTEWIAKKRTKYLKGKKCAICGEDNIKKLRLSLKHKSSQVSSAHNAAHGGALWSASLERRRRLLKGSRVLCTSCLRRNVWADRNRQYYLFSKEIIRDIEEIFNE